MNPVMTDSHTGDGGSGMVLFLSSHSLSPADSSLTPEQKLEQALAARQAAAPKLPTYMNPGAANPAKMQLAQEKRKLLWNKSKVRLGDGMCVVAWDYIAGYVSLNSNSKTFY